MLKAEQSRKEILEAARQGVPVEFYIVRHGATRLNAESAASVDRERGWSQCPLTAEGAESAREAALKLKDKGIGAIRCSDLARSAETAEIIGRILDLEPQESSKLRPWGLGFLTNKVMATATPQIERYARDKPDMPVPEGESFNEFKRRAFKGLYEAITKHHGKKVLVVSHLRVESLLRAWQAAGQPIDHGIDVEAFLSRGEPPGAVRMFKTHLPLLRGELDRKLTHLEANYHKGHDPEFCHTCEYSNHLSAPTCSLVTDISRNGWCRLWAKSE
jgi:broad specificity phosphatase PhoE